MKTIRHSRRIAVVGGGLIGSALAGHLILAGNRVIIGARRRDTFAPPDYQRDDIDYPVRTIEEALDGRKWPSWRFQMPPSPRLPSVIASSWRAR
jgi:2-polyprenyl-6-methoxyphenol hydroxylase-like FAD-dependent oxidoreductase